MNVINDPRRVAAMSLSRALKNPHTASDWLADQMKLEPHQVHVKKTETEEQTDKFVTTLEGVLIVPGTQNFTFQVQVVAAK